jgi:thiamine kinase
MTWYEACSLDESLASLEAYFQSPPKLVELLSGGLSNRCWKVTSADDNCFVWRPNSAASHAFGISRMREHRLLEALEECHFAPDAVYLNDLGLLVEWIDEDSDSHIPIGELELTGMLARVHAVDIHTKPIPLFAYTAKVDNYWVQLGDPKVRAEYESLYQRYRNLPTVPPVEPCLCHLDLGEYNLVMTEGGLKVIDWEYAGVTDPRLDLAMTIEVAGLDMPRAVANYCKLRRIEDVEPWLTGVNHWRPRVRMMAMLWYLLGYRLWQDERYLQQALELKKKLQDASIQESE